MKKKYTMKYKSCKHTPCGSSLSTHNNCKPNYCAKKIKGKYKPTSKNWSLCNMKNWYAKGTRKNFYYKSKCRTPKRIKKSKKNKINEYQVDALELHNKMPFIWRYLSPKTQVKMILIAKLPVHKINTWPSIKKTKKNLKNKKLKKEIEKVDKIKKMLRKHNL